MKSSTPYQLKLIDNYEFDEVASAMQKCIRRNMEYDATWWAFVLHESGYHKYMWRRLLIIASEDIGNATADAAVLVNVLYQNYQAAISATNRQKNDALVFAFQAVIYLCRATKTREADSLVNLVRTEYSQGKRLQVPTIAIDMHTRRGRQIHGGWQDGDQAEINERHRKWFNEFSKVEPYSGEDRYISDLRKLKRAE